MIRGIVDFALDNRILVVALALLLFIGCRAAVDEQKFSTQQAHTVGAVLMGNLGFGAGGDIGRHFNAHTIQGTGRCLSQGLLLLAPQFLRIANLVDLGVACIVRREFQAPIDGVQYHTLAWRYVEYLRAQCDHTWQAFATGENRHMRGCAALGHADAGSVLCCGGVHSGVGQGRISA